MTNQEQGSQTATLVGSSSSPPYIVCRPKDRWADALRLQVRSWLDPPEYMDVYEVARSRIHESSGGWFFEEEGVRKWKAGAALDGNKRWIHGTYLIILLV